MRRGVRRDVVRKRGGDAPALEVDPLRVGDTVRHTHLPEGPPEPPGPRKRPIVIEEGMPQLVEDQPAQRSEEHTSELQSQSNLVCRLLLEKKKKKQTQNDQRLLRGRVSIVRDASTDV